MSNRKFFLLMVAMFVTFMAVVYFSMSAAHADAVIDDGPGPNQPGDCGVLSSCDTMLPVTGTDSDVEQTVTSEPAPLELPDDSALSTPRNPDAAAIEPPSRSVPRLRVVYVEPIPTKAQPWRTYLELNDGSAWGFRDRGICMSTNMVPNRICRVAFVHQPQAGKASVDTRTCVTGWEFNHLPDARKAVEQMLDGPGARVTGNESFALEYGWGEVRKYRMCGSSWRDGRTLVVEYTKADVLNVALILPVSSKIL